MKARVFFMFFCLFLSVMPVLGQDGSRAVFSADRGAVSIGEPIQLTLTVQVPAQSFVDMPVFPQDWPPFMVKTMGEWTESTQGGAVIYHQVLTVILWQLGDYRTPETYVNYHLVGSNQILQLPVEPAFFTVTSVLKEDDLALRPFKPPIALPYFPIWVILLVLAFITGGAIALMYFFWARKVFPVGKVVNDTAAGFHVSAQKALRELKFISERVSNPAEIYAKSADCLRVYLHGRFDVAADDMTTGELQSVLQAKPIVADRRERELEHLLEHADLVKFAQLQPKSASAQQFVIAAQRWIQTVEQAESDAKA